MPTICSTPKPLTAAQTAASAAAHVERVNARDAASKTIRDTAAWGAVDAMATIDKLNAPLVRSRNTAAVSDLRDLQKELDAFRTGRLVTAQTTQPFGPDLRTGHPGGQRVVDEKLFFEIKGARLTAAEAIDKVKNLAAEVRLIASDNNVALPPR